jgi:hypothetical protein
MLLIMLRGGLADGWLMAILTDNHVGLFCWEDLEGDGREYGSMLLVASRAKARWTALKEIFHIDK